MNGPMHAQVARKGSEIAGGTMLELLAIGGLVGVALTVLAHVTGGVETGWIAAAASLLFGHIFGRIGARSLRDAAQRGALIALGITMFGLAAGLLLGAPLAVLNACAAGALAAPLGALVARGVHGF